MTDETLAPLFAELRFTADGLIPAIAQQFDSGEVLMMAWMNAESIAESLAAGRVCYWSRSRGALWRKGETSGQVQALVALRPDCDGDALLLLVDQKGVACHTGRRSCFFREWQAGGLVTLTEPQISEEDLYGKKPTA
ncbi:phosphoribosyl-AMP cyclohydrolase [Oleispirillum naphthae]|uniref:phosphoribosyl-AMP cyclohydrolase n=1 Tax=Oleispirillum naphthae TaxID=2838853 RepID=UPI0030822CBE